VLQGLYNYCISVISTGHWSAARRLL